MANSTDRRRSGAGIAIVVIGGVLAVTALAVLFVPGAEFLAYFALIFVYWGIYLVPLLLLVTAAVFAIRHFTGRDTGGARKLGRFTGGYVALLAGLGALLFAWSATRGSSSYRQVGGAAPYTLPADVMAGSDTITLGVRVSTDDGSTQAALVTAPARDIESRNNARGVGRKHRLRLIAATPEVTLTVTPGEGMTLEGEMTIPPGTWRDFSIRAFGGEATMKSTGTGSCPLGRDPHDCRK